MNIRLLATLMLLGAGFVIGACGGDDDDSDSSTTGAATIQTQTQTTETQTTKKKSSSKEKSSSKKKQNGSSGGGTNSGSQSNSTGTTTTRRKLQLSKGEDFDDVLQQVSFGAAKKVCKQRSLKQLDKIYKPKSHGSQDVAKAVSRTYSPKSRRDAAYDGCLEGFSQR